MKSGLSVWPDYLTPESVHLKITLNCLFPWMENSVVTTTLVPLSSASCARGQHHRTEPLQGSEERLAGGAPEQLSSSPPCALEFCTWVCLNRAPLSLLAGVQGASSVFVEVVCKEATLLPFHWVTGRNEHFCLMLSGSFKAFRRRVETRQQPRELWVFKQWASFYPYNQCSRLGQPHTF